MAWIQNLSGQAEIFLNKIDEKAGDVLRATTKSKKHDEDVFIPVSEVKILGKEEIHVQHNGEKLNILKNDPFEEELQEVINEDILNSEKSIIPITSIPVENESNQEVSQSSSPSSQKSVRSNSLQCAEEARNYEYIEKIENLEYINDNLSRELLNVQHLYSNVNNENVILKRNLERANEMVDTVQKEMEQYKARTYRMLKEKEKESTTKSDYGNDKNLKEKMLIDSISHLKQELKVQENKNEEHIENIANLTSKLSSLQRVYGLMQDKFQESNEKLKKELSNERKTLTILEQDLSAKSLELNQLQKEIALRESDIMLRDQEIQQLRYERKEQTPEIDDDLHNKFQALNQTLIINQKKLEAAISEKNGLRIQLEMLENEYSKALTVTRNYQQQSARHNYTDDVKLQTPQMAYSSSDAAVTRRIKHAYSCLDAFSIKVGVFLRRHPKIRVIIFGYMILLHLWVLIILWNYAPNVK